MTSYDISYDSICGLMGVSNLEKNSVSYCSISQWNKGNYEHSSLDPRKYISEKHRIVIQ